MVFKKPSTEHATHKDSNTPKCLLDLSHLSADWSLLFNPHIFFLLNLVLILHFLFISEILLPISVRWLFHFYINYATSIYAEAIS